MSNKTVNFDTKEPLNMSMSLDLNFFLLMKIINVFRDTYKTKEEKMGLINSLLEQWEKRLINQQKQMNKVNAHALASNSDEISEDVADILMDIHCIETDTIRKEFKRFTRHILRQNIEENFK